jgi:hypothetical protein
VRPERLLAAAPLVLRFAPDRRRALRGSVQPGAGAGLIRSASRFVTASKTTGPIEATSAARSLAIYRTRLADLLARAEIVAQDESAEIYLAVSALVERLSGDLIRLYDDLERGALAQSDRVTVPASMSSPMARRSRAIPIKLFAR